MEEVSEVEVVLAVAVEAMTPAEKQPTQAVMLAAMVVWIKLAPAYRATLALTRGQSEVTVSSNLVGLQIDLPVPLAIGRIFIGGARMDLFRSAGGHTFVSIATTGNLMRFVQSLGAVLQERSALRWQQVGVSSLVVFAFVGGALAGAAASVALGPAALWGAVALELAAVLLYAFGD